MSEIIENLSHVMRGAALMFFILLSVTIYTHRKESNFKRILFWSMIFLCVLILKDMMFLDTDTWNNPYLCGISLMTDLLYVPVMALFFFEAVIPGWINAKRVALFFLPGAAAVVLYIVRPDILIIRYTILYMVIFGLTVVTVILLAMSRRDNRIKDYFSDTSDISVTWVWKALCTLFFSLIAWTVLMWKSSWLGDSLYFLISICCWTYIYRLAVKHKVVEIPAADTEERPEDGDDVNPAGQPAALTAGQTSPIQEKLEKCMGEDEIFLNHRLTLSDLAVSIGTNRTYLSDYLNRVMNTTFYEYINGARAQKAASLIREYPEKTFTEIADMSGFNSLSTFYRSFTKHIGIPPARFKEKMPG